MKDKVNMSVRSWLTALFPVLSLLVLMGAGTVNSVQAAEMKKIEGDVWYRERLMLPPGSELKVSLEDVAKMDVAADIVATSTYMIQGGPPYRFELDYDSAKIDDRGRYNLRARIENQGRLLFISTEHTPAFPTVSDGSVDIKVSYVARNSKKSSNRNSEQAHLSDASLSNTYWKAQQLRGEPVALGAGERELQMVMTNREEVRGFSGCNKFRGHYIWKDNQLRFGQLLSTRMACFEAMEQEGAFLSTLAEVVRFSIAGQELTLYDKENQPILLFEAVYLQ